MGVAEPHNSSPSILVASLQYAAWRYREGEYALFYTDHLLNNFRCISSITLQYLSAVMVSPSLRKLLWIILATDHKIVTITFLNVNLASEKVLVWHLDQVIVMKVFCYRTKFTVRRMSL